jgi:hypothetical protein
LPLAETRLCEPPGWQSQPPAAKRHSPRKDLHWCGFGEVSEWPKERDWKSRTCRKVGRGFKSRPLRLVRDALAANGERPVHAGFVVAGHRAVELVLAGLEVDGDRGLLVLAHDLASFVDSFAADRDVVLEG